MKSTAILTFLLVTHFGVIGQTNESVIETPKPTLNSINQETENVLIEKNAIDPALKFQPQVFYILNEVPVSKEIYMEFLRQKELELNAPNSQK
jgi:hypothetical protein